MKTRSLSELRQDTKPAESKHEQLSMSIDQSGVEHLMGTLTNLYSNPAVAVFREYVSNALDSHIKAKQKKPIEIEITNGREVKSPYSYRDSTFEDQKLIIRDFGVGLSKDDVVNVYSRYASSTKRDSNEQVGAFGLGAKSALAITNRFDVVAVKDKVKLEFFIEKNEKGVGIVNFVSEKPATEPNGVTVTIPISHAHSEQIKYEVKQEGFFLTWNPETYILKGKFDWSEDNSAYNSERYFTIYEGEDIVGWVSYATRGNQLPYNHRSYGMPSVSIAGIGYSIAMSNQNAIRKLQESESGKFLMNAVSSNHKVVINMPIGSLDLTPSREQIMFTEKSLKAFQSAFNRFQDLLVTELESHISQLEPKPAMEFYFSNLSLFSDKYTDKLNPHYKSTRDTLGNFYQGQEIPLLVTLDQPVWKISTPTLTSWATEEKLTQISLFEAAVESKTSKYMPYRFEKAFLDGVTHILIYGKTPKRTDIKDELARVKRNARSYAQSIHDDYDRRLVDAYYYDSDTKPDNLWIDATMEVVHIDELERVGKEYRSELARQKAKDATRSKRETAIHFGITSDKNGLVGEPKLFSPAELSGIKNIIMLDQESLYYPKTPGRSGLHELIWDNYTGTLKESMPEFDKMAAHLAKAFKDTTIIFVPRSRRLGPIQKANPNAKTLTQYINAKIDSYNTRSKEYKEFMAYLSVPTDQLGSNSLIDYLGNNHAIESIEDEFTRGIFYQYYSGGEKASLAYVISYFYNFKSSTLGRKEHPENMYCHNLLDNTWHSTIHPAKSWWSKYSIFSNGNNDGTLTKMYVQAINAIS